jgi:hypothetical protein
MNFEDLLDTTNFTPEKVQVLDKVVEALYGRN